MISRLRDVMTSVFPFLERGFDYSSCKGALVLLTGYVTPEQIRRLGQVRLAGRLQRRRVRNFAQLAARAVAAARSQHVVLPGQDIAAGIITELSTAVLALDERITALDSQITRLFRGHRDAASIESMPGFGSMLLAAAGDLRAFPSAGHLAAAAGLVPMPNDSGRRTGNLHRPRRYSRPLRHAFYLAAQTSSMRAGRNRDYYLHKRARGRRHTQALIALAAAESTCAGARSTLLYR
ncbi:transposase [Nocardia brevicatena]|uniref:transposase n=1 Tax=Nocardia brevicatena TaxID=37327 RepID=UPI0002DA3F51|nr:transposase [Nocardia brevicatena]